MSEPFIGELRLFGCGFAPRGWSTCEGQLLPIAQNTALFSLLGTTYGGDGRTSFGLPDLRGRAPIGRGNGPGLPNYNWGAKSGRASITLTAAEMPNHTHTISVSEETGTQRTPGGALLSQSNDGENNFRGVQQDGQIGSLAGVSSAGGNQAFNSMNPYLAMYWCIALLGVYPSRS